jgi:hypothetical protein
MSTECFIGRPQAEASQYNRASLKRALDALYDTYILEDRVALKRGTAIRAINARLVYLGYSSDTRND